MEDVFAPGRITPQITPKEANLGHIFGGYLVTSGSRLKLFGGWLSGGFRRLFCSIEWVGAVVPAVDVGEDRGGERRGRCRRCRGGWLGVR